MLDERNETVERIEHVQQPADRLNGDQVFDIVDKCVVDEIRPVLGEAVPGDIFRTGVEREPKASELLDDEALAGRLHEADEDVGFALGQADQMTFGHEFNQHARLAFNEFDETFRNKPGADAFHGHDPNAAGRGHVLGAEGLRYVAGFLFYPLRDRKQTVALLGQHEAVGFPVEQFDRQVFLEFGDAAADGGVIDAKTPRGRRQPALSCQFEEEDQVVPVKHGKIPSSRSKPEHAAAHALC